MSELTGPAGRTRGATRASQTPKPDTRTVDRTPAARRRRNIALEDGLPEVPVGTNLSYGATGRVDLGSQVGTRTTDAFTSQFRANRGAAVNRSGPVPVVSPPKKSRASSVASSAASSPAATSKDRRPRRRVVSRAASIPEDDDDSEGEQYEKDDVAEDPSYEEITVEDDVLDVQYTINDNVLHSDDHQRPSIQDTKYSVTDINSTFEYGAPPRAPSRARSYRRQASLPAQLPPAMHRRLAASARTHIASTAQRLRGWPRNAAERLAQLVAAVPGPVRATLALAPLVFLVLALLQYTSVPRLTRNLVGDISDFVTESIDSARNATLQKPMFDGLLHSRIESIEADLKNLKTDLSSMKDVLPDQLVVKSNPETKSLEIAPAFWDIVRQKLHSDYSLKPGSNPGANIAWEKFVQSNKASVQSMIQSASDDHIQSLVSSDKIISKQMFLNMVEKHNTDILTRVEAKLAGIQGSSERIAREAATRISNEIASRRVHKKKDEPKYLDDLVVKAYVDNALLERERNFFSPGNGAVVDPHLTSPTYAPAQRSPLARLWVWSGLAHAAGNGAYSRAPLPNSPAAALAPWSDVGDCWCAAASLPPDTGMAQIAVLLAHHVRVSSLVLDHIPSTATMDVSSAPRKVEVWGLPEGAPAYPVTDRGPEAAGGGCITADPQPGKGWLCLGAGEYSIHGANHVQSLPVGSLDGPLVTKVVVRVLGNWGGERTCLYRVRLLGKDRDEVEDEMRGGETQGL